MGFERRAFLGAAAAAGAGLAASAHPATPSASIAHPRGKTSRSPHVIAPEALAALLGSVMARTPA